MHTIIMNRSITWLNQNLFGWLWASAANGTALFGLRRGFRNRVSVLRASIA